MPYLTTAGLVLKVPTRATKNWDQTVLDFNWKKIASHAHTGTGDGNQITAAGLSSNSVTEDKIRLSNNAWLKARNATDSGDVNIVRVNAVNALEFGMPVVFELIQTPNLSTSNVTVISGFSFLKANATIQLIHTYTVNSGGFLEVIDTLTVLGTLVVNSGGAARAI